MILKVEVHRYSKLKKRLFLSIISIMQYDNQLLDGSYQELKQLPFINFSFAQIAFLTCKFNKVLSL